MLIMDKVKLLWELASLKDELEKARSLVTSLSVRVAVQSELLGRSAEGRNQSAQRIRELEGALAPFVAVLATGWDTGELPANALYPVQMGDIRQAARALAGTNHKAN